MAAGEDRAAYVTDGPLRSLQDDHRTARFHAMVRAYQTTGGESAGCGGGRTHPIHAGELDPRLRPLDGERPRLMHFPAALVGAPHSRVVLPKLPQDYRGAEDAR